MEMKKKSIVLFDVDGTLTPARNVIEQDMKDTLHLLKNKTDVAVVGGSDEKKIIEQLGIDTVKEMNYAFFENGLVAWKNGTLLAQTSIKDFLGEDKLKRLINFLLKNLAEIDIPIKRGTFIEYRIGMLNVSPIGRNCSQQERNEYEKYDLMHKIRENLIKKIYDEFSDYSIKCSIGGQISFDIFPIGWDKTYCLKYIEKEYEEIHFIGDKTFVGGNDYEICSDERVKGYSVKSPDDTIKLLKKTFIL